MQLAWLISAVELNFNIGSQGTTRKPFWQPNVGDFPSMRFPFIWLHHCNVRQTKLIYLSQSCHLESDPIISSSFVLYTLWKPISSKVLRLLINICRKSQIRSNLLSTPDKTNLNTGRSKTEQNGSPNRSQDSAASASFFFHVLMCKTQSNSIHLRYHVASLYQAALSF